MLCLRRSHVFGVFLAVALCVGPAPLPTAANDEAPRPVELIEEGRRLLDATDMGRAFTVLEQALAEARRRGDRGAEVRAQMFLAEALHASHAQDRGLERLQEAHALAAGLGEAALEAEALTRLARVRLALGEAPRAWTDLEEAEEIYADLGDDLGQAQATATRSALAVHSRAFHDAIDAGRQALPRLEEAGALGEALVALSSIAYAHHQLEEYEAALEAYERVLDLGWQKNDQRMINFAYCNRAEIRWLQGERRPALEDLQKAVDGFEESRERLPGTFDQRAEFLALQVEAYERLIRYLADTYRGLEAFEVAERFHGRSFRELLDSSLLETGGGRHEEERRALLDELGRARLSLEGDAAGERKSTAQRRIRSLEVELESLQAEAMGRGRHFRRLVTPEDPSLEEVQRSLRPEEALVAYWVARDRLVAWVVNAGGASVAQVPVSRHRLEETVSRYLENLRSPGLAEDAAMKGAEEAHLELGQQLHRWLVGGLPAAARRARRWILVPDGVLHYLPFEALVTGCDQEPAAEGPSEATPMLHAPYRSCHFLGLEKALSYAPSAGALLALRERQQERQRQRIASRGARGSLLALAPSFDPDVVPAETLRRGLRSRGPLLYAEDEVRRIAALFEAGSAPLTEKEATERQLKDRAGGYRLVHLATHGLVRDDLPMSSGLLLAAGDGEDGLLQAHEVLGLRLDADLVTLSGCRTGRGGLRRGEGIVGLSRSFLTAGAASVVVSLWDVDDRSTPVLMEAFYRHLADGVPAAEALLEARRTLFRTTGESTVVFKARPVSHAHPRFWAPFILVGAS